MQAPTKPKSKKMIFITFQPKNAKTESNRKNEPKNEIGWGNLFLLVLQQISAQFSVLNFTYYTTESVILKKFLNQKTPKCFGSYIPLHELWTVLVHSVKNSRSQKYRTAKKMLLIALEYFCGYEIRWSTPLKIKYLICSYFVNFETRSLKWTI